MTLGQSQKGMVMSFVKPRVYLVGYTQIDRPGLLCYLEHTDNLRFLDYVNEAVQKYKLSDGEILCSLYAKLCYKSLSPGHNTNITNVRNIYDNLLKCIESAHIGVFRHFNLNFIVTDCARIFTHEQVRHSAGVAYSQTSGRYCRLPEEFSFIMPPELEGLEPEIQEYLEHAQRTYSELCKKTGLDNPDMSFNKKKKITSALRRLMPEGLAVELGITINIQALRHTIMMRTSRAAEWEIRYIYNQIYQIIKQKYPLLVHDARTEMVDDLFEITGMTIQPYTD